MKKQPNKIKQWAQDAYNALEIAWGLLMEEFSNPNEDQKMELLRYAPAIAGMNRGITDKGKITEAYEFIYGRTAEDLKNMEDGEPIIYSIFFLIGYLDAHISFGILNEKKADDIMAYLSEHYDISYEA